MSSASSARIVNEVFTQKAFQEAFIDEDQTLAAGVNHADLLKNWQQVRSALQSFLSAFNDRLHYFFYIIGFICLVSTA